jgi:hypothetical protein
MVVTVPIPLTPEEQAALLAHAQDQGVSVDFLLRQAVLSIISAAQPASPEQSSAEQWETEFGEWLDSLPSLPTLSDEAISRDSIYTREDDWR